MFVRRVLRTPPPCRTDRISGLDRSAENRVLRDRRSVVRRLQTGTRVFSRGNAIGRNVLPQNTL